DSTPDSALRMVDLPAPLAPMRATIPPLPTPNEPPRTAWIAPYETWRSRTSRRGEAGSAATAVEVAATSISSDPVTCAGVSFGWVYAEAVLTAAIWETVVP